MVITTVGVGVGETFTDVVLATDGDLTTTRVPSTTDQSKGAIQGIQRACAEAGIEPAGIDEFSHAMTVSTNALLEVDDAESALVMTDGFCDVLEIGRQTRPDLYDLQAEKPPVLVRRRNCFEIAERTTTDGERTEPSEVELNRLVDVLRGRDIESVVISFLHAYVDATNEQLVASRLRDELEVTVSASQEVLNEFREYGRTSTAAVDAYVTPVLTERRRYQPQGTAGGAPGACGEDLADGEPLPSKVTEQMEAGTMITIRTPGGGGYGEPANRAADAIDTDRRDEKVTSSHSINPPTGEVPPRTDDADDSETSS